MQSFFEEIFQQPDSLDHLLDQVSAPTIATLQTRLVYGSALFIGMGASYHAASIAAHGWRARGLDVHAAEAIDVLNYTHLSLRNYSTLIYISQSGASGEVTPIFSRLPADIHTAALTNDANSPLAERAQVTLPLCAGEEYTVATKTYLNTLALLQLLAGTSIGTLRGIAARVRALLDAAETIRALWLDTLAGCDALYFVGHGAHAITARQCSMMVGEWAKKPAVGMSIGAFRHGFIEVVEPGVGIVIFAPEGAGRASALELAQEVERYGARVLLVTNGQSYTRGMLLQAVTPIDETLSPMLDVIPGQLFAEAFARHRGIAPGFRHIRKVVSKV